MLDKIQKLKSTFIMLVALGVGVFVFGLNIEAQEVGITGKQLDLSAYIVNDKNVEIPNGNYDVRFAIYTSDREEVDPYPSNSDAGSRVWEEEQEVQIINGTFSVYLGSVNPIPETLNFEEANYYLGIRINGDSEAIPRKKIGYVPLAMNANYLRGAKIGTEEGDILQLGNGGKIDIDLLPIGDGDNEIMTGSSKNLHSQNTDTGTESQTFNIGSDTASAGNNFDLTVSSDTNKPTIRFNGTAQTWEYSNDGSNFSSLTTASADSIVGIIGLENGGTGSSSFASGSVVFSDGTKLTQDNSNFYWDDVNNRLGIGTSSPNAKLSVVGDAFIGSNVNTFDSISEAATKTVDPTNDSGRNSSMILGNDGFPRIAYFETWEGVDYLKYAQCEDAECSSVNIAIVDPNARSTNDRYTTSIKIGPDGFAHIAYFDDLTDSLKYAKCNDDACSSPALTTIDSDPSRKVGQGADMVLDNFGNPNITYMIGGTGDGNGGNLELARYVGGGSGAGCADTNDWTCSTVSSTGGKRTTVKLGADGFLRIADFYANGIPDESAVRFIKCNNTDCSSNVVNEVFSYTFNDDYDLSMTLGQDGFGRICFQDQPNDDLVFVQCLNDECSSIANGAPTMIDDSGSWTGMNTSIQIGSDGFARISYEDDDNEDLKYAVCENDDCSNNTIYTLDSDLNYADYSTSLVLAADDSYMISYYDENNADLKFAYESNHSFTPNGNDLFVAGDVGIGNDLYANGDLLIEGGINQYSTASNNLTGDLNVIGNINTEGSYQISGSDIIKLGNESIFVGINSGGALTYDWGSTALGYESLYNGESSANTAVGYQALYGTPGGWGGYNTAVGYQALRQNYSGYYNVANGYYALYNNYSGSGNVAAGYQSMYGASNATGSYNVASGYQTLYSNYSGNYNIATGYYALGGNDSGSYNSATGYFAAYTNNSGNYNVADGYRALQRNYSGSDNIALGREALYSGNSASGSYNFAAGYRSLYSNYNGTYNIANGANALYTNYSGSGNIANGQNTLRNNYSGSYNIASGLQSLYSNYDGVNNVAFGNSALYTNYSGNYNIASGYYALNRNYSGSYNIADGYFSLYNNRTGSYNIASGYQALYGSSNAIGEHNVALGYQPLYTNYSGYYNVALGHSALRQNYSGTQNVALGYQPLYVNYSGQNNVALGGFSLFRNYSGSYNIAAGYQSMYGASNAIGSNNIALGQSALYANYSGYGNIALGLNSLRANNSGYNNVSAGYEAMYSNTTGYNNIASGYRTLYSNTTGTHNVALGRQALYSGNSFYNIAIGDTALFSNLSGQHNVATGTNALYNNSAGSYNVASGYQALYGSINAVGSDNIAFGRQSLYNNYSGNYNIAFGQGSLYDNYDGQRNIAFGYNSLYNNVSGNNNVAGGYRSLMNNTTGDDNIAFGYEALLVNSVGINNIANGFRTLYSNISGSNNIASGAFALYGNTTGAYNIATGYGSLDSNTEGSNNVAVGYSSLGSNTVGIGNISFGRESMYSNVSGNYNIAIGDRSADNLTTGSNNIIIGYNVDAQLATGSNQLSIGNLIFGTGIDGTGTTISSGNIGIGVNPSNFKLEVAGSIGPSIDDTYDLGSSTNRWRDLYLGPASLHIGTYGDEAVISYDTANDILNIDKKIVTTGNVGIGSSDPAQALHLSSSSSSLVRFDKTASSSSEGANSGGTFVEDTSVGAAGWEMYGGLLSNVAASDNQYAVSGGVSPTVTYYLKATDFGFNIPAGSIIDGIVVGIEKSGEGEVYDNSVKIVKGGVLTGTDKADTVTPWGVESIDSYGGSSDLWGETWTASDINSSNFGVAISASFPIAFAFVDHITITVHYSVPEENWVAGLDASDSSFKISNFTDVGTNDYLTITAGGEIGVSTTSPTARLHLPAGTATAGTAPLKLTTGTNLTTPEAGAIEFDGTNLYYTDSALTRQTLVVNGGSGSSLWTDAGTHTYLTSTADQLSVGTSSPTAGAKLTISGLVSQIGLGSSTYFGEGAGSVDDLTNNYNVGFGYHALTNNTGGYNNSAFGYNALGASITSFQNTAVGHGALSSVVSGGANTAIGSGSLQNNTGSWNTAIGLGALGSNVSGTGSTAVGALALSSNTGSGNSAFGGSALSANTTGTSNVAVGSSLVYNQTGSNNTVVGAGAGNGTSGLSNISNSSLLGYRAGYALLTGGNNNILLGYQAGDNLTTGSSNIVIGYDIDAPAVDSANTLNIGNLIFGTGIDGTGTTISSGNIGIGTASPDSRLEIVNNAAVRNYVTAYHDTGVGANGPYFTGRRAGGTESLPTAILADDVMASFGGTGWDGTQFKVSAGGPRASIEMYASENWSTTNMGTYMVFQTTADATTNPVTRMMIDQSGYVAIGNIIPDQALDVDGTIQSSSLLGGAVNLTTDANGNIIRDPSDISLKERVLTIDNALDKVLQLRGVSYYWKDEERFGSQQEIGFIAQEVQEILPEVVRTGGEYMSLNTRNILGVVVEAIKEEHQNVLINTENIDGITLQTNQNITTIEELQKSIDNELLKISSQFTDYSSQIDDINLQLTALEAELQGIDLNLMNTQINELMDFMLAMETNMFVKLNAVATGNILLDGKLEATEIESGLITIKVVDNASATIGTATICPKDTYYDEINNKCETAIDIDGDGLDDSTDAVVSTGVSTIVYTSSVLSGSKIFVTLKDSLQIVPLKAGNVIAGESFEIESGSILDDKTTIDWWIVGTE